MKATVSALPTREEWQQQFLNTDVFKAAHRLMMDSAYTSNILNKSQVTPRAMMLNQGVLDLQPFYILDYISKQNDLPIHDIGCGINFFKNFYNIIGIDPYSEFADISDAFNATFAKEYKGQFDNAISICAIHFCNIAKMPIYINHFINLVKSGGYVYITLNVPKLLENTDVKFTIDLVKKISTLDDRLIPILNAYSNNQIDTKLLGEYFTNIVNQIDDHVLLYENLIEELPAGALNGNIRILLKRK